MGLAFDRSVLVKPFIQLLQRAPVRGGGGWRKHGLVGTRLGIDETSRPVCTAWNAVNDNAAMNAVV